ncbi:alcohol dehydrogenase [Subtercola sp. Z020]|uniref:alcohol dehydrogenase catalytic domain-containing protein n=1 Tax=Subtercola sp. Z020 TaxID=2080582 RepID=UPI000CE8D494|nr:alcohol dehydrogenase catalytic domain-containing protein [Subtercola sp. Z020]PPF85655.1 alcohol dehydrogenase [Subtercola sp. Z020]
MNASTDHHASGSLTITGAVLEEIGRPGPYSGSRPLTISELQLAPPRAGEVLVRIEAAGLCHSDLSVVDGNRSRPVPMLLGHEAAGTIEEVGPDVADHRVGDRVVMTFLPRCGACAGCATDGIRPCINGSASNGAGTLIGGGRRLERDGEPVHHHLGVSAFATHAVVSTHSIVSIGDDVPAEVAAVLGCAVLTGGGAVINAARPKPGETVLVVGLGGVGMAALITALALDDVRVVAVDALQAKLDVALELGAAAAYTPADASAAGIRATSVIEAAGSARALEAALSFTDAGGRTVTVGLPSPDARVSFSPTALVAEGRSIIGSYLGSAVPSRDIPLFADLWRAGRLPVERLISSHIALGDINEGMDALARGEAIRQIITFA